MILSVADNRHLSAAFYYNFAFRNAFGCVIRSFGVKIGTNRANQFPDRRLCKNRYVINEFQSGNDFRAFHHRMLRGATAAGARVASMGMYSGKLPVPVGTQVYTALVRPLLEYAAEIWSVRPWPAAGWASRRGRRRFFRAHRRGCPRNRRSRTRAHGCQSRRRPPAP